jgi:surface carbohydrate biosynthesis protein
MKATLLLPVESQVRELDPKLLLACVAARGGLTSILGPKRKVESRIASLPRGIYISKSLKASNGKFLWMARMLGHECVAWDEEALVRLPPETYFSRRLSSKAVRNVSHLFAWGQDNADLWRQYPELPAGIPIHITGNPRGDLLRPELRSFYAEIVEELRNTNRDFILINTNFSSVNAFTPVQNLFRPIDKPENEPKLGRLAEGMSREYAEGLRDHKQSIFEAFQHLIPAIEKTFPDYFVVVRPHPSENQRIYHKIAAQCERVRVTNDGNVVPWLMAARAVIHNGCTTGVEAYVLGVPAISYRPTIHEHYDYAFHRLPNLLSHQAFDFEKLGETLGNILSGQLGAADGDERQALINHHLAAQEGPLACERIVEVLAQIMEGSSKLPKLALRGRVEGRFRITKRRLLKWYKSRSESSHTRPKFQRHRYPVISIEETRKRISRFQQVLGDSTVLNVEEIHDQIFRISG